TIAVFAAIALAPTMHGAPPAPKATPPAPAVAPPAPAAAAPAAPPSAAHARYPAAVEVFPCDFGAQWDLTFARWPHRWTRARPPTYPPYLPVRITDDLSPDKNHSLRIDLDGGAAAVFSPPFKVSPIFSYVVEAVVRTDGLVRDDAFLSITF